MPQTTSLPAEGLPLTVFEELMLVDDRASHPMVIVMRFDFVDDAPPRHLEEAFYDTLRDEPLLTARVESTLRGRPRWVSGHEPRLTRSRTTAVFEGLAQVTGPLPRLDARSGPVLHADVVEHPLGWSIVLAVHHAASDGIGLLGFLERWLLSVEGKPGRWRREAGGMRMALMNRGRVASSWMQFARLLPAFGMGLRNVVEFLAHRVIALKEEHGDRRQPAPAAWEPHIVCMSLESALARELAKTAKSHRVTVHDCLVAALAVVLGEHVAALSPRHPGAGGSWIRIGVPMSVRERNDRVLPAANRIGMAFLDRRPELCRDPLPLMLGMHGEMEFIRERSLGHLFSLGLEWRRRLPGGIRRSTDHHESQCTAILSNVGRAFHRSPLVDAYGTVRIGGGRMSTWWGVPPIRPGTALAAGTHETAGRRTIAFQVDRECVSSELAERLIRRMATELNDLAGGRRVTEGTRNPPVR